MHLAGCATCTQNLEAYQVMSEVLGEKTVWDFSDTFEDGVENGAAAIRAFAEKMEHEDDDAVALVDELVKLPRQWWMTTIEADERYRNAGVLRRLIEVSYEKIETMPAEAVDAGAAAVKLAQSLNGDEIPVLHARACREYAYALMYTGDAKRALEVVDEGESLLDRCGAPELLRARLEVVRALTYRLQSRCEEGLPIARGCAQVFREYGDVQQFVSARLTEAFLYIFAENLHAALPILVDLEQNWSNQVSPDTHARILSALAGCQQRLGRASEAIHTLQGAARLFEELGNVPESARARYVVGELLASQSKTVEAKQLFRESIREFERLGMAHTAVCARLELAEIAVTDGDFSEVEMLCRSAIRQFEAAGVAYTREALTALT
ncbi:MAG TPA: tetratricopeptide repeat protein, partial [Thermoanaerobaculia bacterium]|nr:tetratricopeptide repeat protein [Thermoanaerobaculia bacterium]